MFAQIDIPAEVTPIIADAVAQELGQALAAGNWVAAVSAALMLGVWLVRSANLLRWVPARFTPAFTVVVGTVPFVTAALAEGRGLGPALISGALAGLGATGLWELLKGFWQKPQA